MKNNGHPARDLGPLPTEASASGLSRAQEAVLSAVRDHGGRATLTELSATTGLHANTLRGHLDVLVDAGLVTRGRALPSGRGRPAILWRARAAQSAEYAGLASALAHTVKATSSEPTTAAMEAGRVWGRQLAGAAPLEGTEACAGALTLLDDLGFAPQAGDHRHEPDRHEPDRREPDHRVRLTRCPLLEAARAEPTIVCNVHLGLIAGALQELGAPDPDVELTPFAEPGACALRISAGR